MNPLETLSRAEAVIDLLRVNLAGDFCATLATNAGPHLIEARQDSGVAACELVAHLIRDARRDIAARLAEEAASAPAPPTRAPAAAPAKKPRKGITASPVPRAPEKTKRRPLPLNLTDTIFSANEPANQALCGDPGEPKSGTLYRCLQGGGVAGIHSQGWAGIA
ncbi:MAG: hypothetical protein Q8O25_16065 [Sulfurisoma sp.]|nr:hypothetical protein [Sulfurisoma sp.]